jgi:PBSX family phage terminase large subunit
MLTILMAIILATGQPTETNARNRPYQPHGAALSMFYDKSDEILMSGPAGTGKSRGILEKLHFCAMKYAGMRGLIVRKTRASLTESGLVTFEEKVLPHGSPMVGNTKRQYRQSYVYPNGSEVIVAGMDNPMRVMSTEYDIIVPLEATELDEEDCDNLSTRLRNGVMPYQQMIADCNPASPRHHLKLRADRGVTKILESRHEDNPTLFDHRKGEYTEFGQKYLSRLDNLSGVRKLRLRHGIWAMAEGMVYADSYDPARNLVYRFDVPKHWQRVWGVDFGYTNPFCWQCWAIDDDGRIYRIAEIYQTKRLVSEHADSILQWQKENGEPDPIAIVTDHDAEDRATLERCLGMRTEPAIKSVSDGIQATANRMRLYGDAKPRLVLLRDSLVSRDTELVEAKKPTCTEDEIEGYVWNEKKDEPVKLNDHGCDTMRYVVMYCDERPGLGVYV